MPPESWTTEDLFIHGQLGYLQIPAADVSRSAAFYAGVFGWHTDPDNAGFEAPGLIGQFDVERPSGAAAGPLLWLVAENMDQALLDVSRWGGELVDSPSLDGGVRLLATVRDPAGNLLGVVSRPET